MKFLTFTSMAMAASLSLANAQEAFAHGKCGFDQLCHLKKADGSPYWFKCDPAAQCTCNGCGGCTLSNINNGFANCE
ncbi:hypothetical protein MBLNU13_g11394t1 [Cladosporium sp. NU13]